MNELNEQALASFWGNPVRCWLLDRWPDRLPDGLSNVPSPKSFSYV